MFKKMFLLFSFVLLSVIAREEKAYGSLPLKTTFVANSFQEGTGEVLLVITIDKGWKLYSPAEATDSLVLEPKLSWDTPENLASIKAIWPEGMKNISETLEGHVYRNAVIVPLTIKTKKPQQSVVLKGTLQGLVCSEIACQPFTYDLNFTFDAASVRENPQKELQKILQSVATAVPTQKEGVSFWTILLLALLGGLMLNVMPCVLPVLGVKLMVFTKTKAASKGGGFAAKDLWMTVLGIYTTFLIFAFITLILKELGETIGWGVHFQNPYFLSFMIVTLICFTANTWGFFEVSPPSWAQNYPSFKKLKGLKSFFSGVLSVLLATPCATPFVGTAVGFALARSGVEILSVFSALGVGFSAPYWVTALLPSHKLPLPKPGPWLIKFQRILGGLLFGTVLWLTFLLISNYTFTVIFLISALILASFLFFWGVHRGIHWLRLPLVTSLLLLLGVPFFPNHWVLNPFEKKEASSALWKNFDPDMIPEHVARGQVVFVDLTASWCLTCHINKRLVLETAAVKKLFHHPKTICMRGDWTKPNLTITEFLKSFEKAGIPFNVVYGPNAPQGISLPEILAVDDVKKAFEKARGIL